MSAQHPAGDKPAAATHSGTDLGAALTGLIFGLIFIFVVVFGIVKATSASMSSHSADVKAAPQH